MTRTAAVFYGRTTDGRRQSADMRMRPFFMPRGGALGQSSRRSWQKERDLTARDPRPPDVIFTRGDADDVLRNCD